MSLTAREIRLELLKLLVPVCGPGKDTIAEASRMADFVMGKQDKAKKPLAELVASSQPKEWPSYVPRGYADD